MELNDYYANYGNLPDDDIARRILEKENELIAIFEKAKPVIRNEAKIAILGCADKRLVKGHKIIFEKTLQSPATIYTFDIDVKHLEREENIIQHDCTTELPNAPYNIIYSQVLLKFIETIKQWDIIYNSYKALAEGGLAMHIFDKEDYDPDSDSGVYYHVPLKDILKSLDEEKIKHLEVPLKYGIALVLFKFKSG